MMSDILLECLGIDSPVSMWINEVFGSRLVRSRFDVFYRDSSVKVIPPTTKVRLLNYTIKPTAVYMYISLT